MNKKYTALTSAQARILKLEQYEDEIERLRTELDQLRYRLEHAERTTITESDIAGEVGSLSAHDKAIFVLALHMAGVEIIDDTRQPTNAEKIEALIRGSSHLGLNDTDLAKYLDANGVKAGN